MVCRLLCCLWLLNFYRRLTRNLQVHRFHAIPLPAISSFEISEDDVILAYSMLKSRAKSNTDRYSALFFEICAYSVMNRFAILFQTCLNSVVFSDRGGSYVQLTLFLNSVIVMIFAITDQLLNKTLWINYILI